MPPHGDILPISPLREGGGPEGAGGSTPSGTGMPSLVSGSYLRLHPSGFGSFITWLVRSCQTPLKHVEVSSKVLFQKNGDVGKAC